MSFLRIVSHRAFLVLLIGCGVATLSAEKKPMPPPPARAKSPVPAVNDDYVHKEFGDNCSLLAGPPQVVGGLGGGGGGDLGVSAPWENPMGDQGESGVRVGDPYKHFIGFGEVKGDLP